MAKESYLAVSTSEDLELLPKGFALSNVLPGILYQQSIPSGFVYHGGNNIHEPHNEIASRLTGFQIQGDAVLEVDSNSLFRKDSSLGKKLKQNGGVCLWEGLPQEILGLIIEQFSDCCANLAITLAQVCRSWREKIVNDSYTMERIKFKNLQMAQGYSTSNGCTLGKHRILQAALHSNNITACIVMARYLTSIRNYTLANKYWKVTAKKSHPEGLAILGFDMYSAGFEREEAYLLLSRACKRLENSLLSGNIPILMTKESCRKLLQRAAHILAILIIDNDFLSPIEKDTSSAVKWLQISHKLGCHEAGKLLQSMFRSGQY